MFKVSKNSCETVVDIKGVANASANMTALLIRDGQVVARFNVPNLPNGYTLINLCHDPRIFTALMHQNAIAEVTVIEMLKLGGESYSYTYRK